MHSSSKFWSCLNYFASIFTFSAVDPLIDQQPIGSHVTPAVEVHAPEVHVPSALGDYPHFPAPGGSIKYKFNCSYPQMPEYEFCGDDAEDRGCWLRPKNRSSTLPTYDIYTDYENLWPTGKDRHYEFNITDGTINADGLDFKQAKLVNGQYPGPWVEACWGDRIIVKVNNRLKFNGTAVHWHGIRQLNSTEMDGVPGLTQCPIAPNETFVYNFKATQYGSAWYHSHYSVQYADGMLGPLTIHGPHAGNFDEPKTPLLMTDWFHNSAYQVIHGNTPGYPTILLNGHGNITQFNYSTLVKDRQLQRVVNTSTIPDQYRLHFDAAKVPTTLGDSMRPQRYLLRLINTAFDTTFVFSIDHHKLTVISADFVPIHNYTTTHLHIGIGQRYNVVVEADPQAYDDIDDKGHLEKHFWIRTTPSPCFGGGDRFPSLQTYDETGVLTYIDSEDDDSKVPIYPITKRWPDIPEKPACQDEDVTKLHPIHRWDVGPPSNGIHLDGNKDWPEPIGERFDVVGDFMFKGKYPKPPFQKDFPLAKFSIERPGTNASSFTPMQIDYNDPFILHLNDFRENKDWPLKWAVVDETHPTGSWIYLAIAGRHAGTGKAPTTGGAHPMHLHGHDFAILQQEAGLELKPENIKLNKDNPARRDVVLLPTDGFVVIAFKIDNPGPWIMHCHIAFHASFGLALQINENQAMANALWPPKGKTVTEARRVCTSWAEFQDDCRLHYPGFDEKYQCYPACNNRTSSLACPNIFQDDSGI